MKKALSVLMLSAAAGSPCPAQTYVFTVDGAASTMSATVEAGATFEGTLIGNYDQTTNPGGTRTLNFDIFGDRPPPPTNIAKTFSGEGESSGNTATNPAGTYRLVLNIGAGTVTMTSINANLLDGATPTFPVDATITYQSFLTANPNNSYPFLFPVPVSLGDAAVTHMTIYGTTDASGTLVPGGPGQYTFAMDVPARLYATITFQGTPVDVNEPQTLAVTGTVSVSDQTATASITFSFGHSDSTTEPQQGPQDRPFDMPALGGGDPAHLLLDMTITGSSTAITGSATLPAAGQLYCRPDINDDGQLTLSDFVAFRNAYTAGDMHADFDGSGTLTLADFVAFRNAYTAGCP